MPEFEASIQHWIQHYGTHAVPFAILSDPAGIPWAWIFLMLLAEEAGKNVALMLFYGFFVLMAFDHVLYWVGIFGGRGLIKKLCGKRSHWIGTFDAARAAIQKRGAVAVVFGRYLPLVGRWMGLGAGLANVSYLKFAIYDAIGAALSAFGFGLLAHFLGRKTIEHPMFYQVLVGSMVVITLVSLLGIAIPWWKSRQNRAPSNHDAREELQS